MVIESIEIEIDLQDVPGQLDVQVIESQLQQWGEPLRWAITAIVSADLMSEHRHGRIARVEAIVIRA